MRTAGRAIVILTIVLSASGVVGAESPDREYRPGDVVEVIDPHMEMHRFGRVVEVYEGVAYGLLFPGETEVHRWYVGFELQPATEDDLRRFEDGMRSRDEMAAFEEGDVVEVMDPHMDMHRYGTIAEVYEDVAYGIMFPGETEVHRWYVDFELRRATAEDLEGHGDSMGPMHGHDEPDDAMDHRH
jgi:hypothetical protein